MPDILVPHESLLQFVTDMIAAGGRVPAKMHLVTEETDFNFTSTLSTMTAAEAAYNDYLPQNVENYSSAIIVDNVAETSPDTISFANTSGDTQIIIGFYLTDADSNYLYAVCRFTDPVPVGTGSALLLSMTWLTGSFFNATPGD